MTKRSECFLLFCVLLLSLGLRLEAIGTTVVNNPIRADAKQYYFGALNLQRYGVFSVAPPADVAPPPDANRPPLVPFLLEPFVTFPPTKLMLLQFNLLQVVLDVMTVLFTFLLFRILAGTGLALGAALLAALSPHLISMTTYLLTETTFTFFLAGGMCAAAYALVQDRIWLAVVGGLFLGLSALARETTTYFPVFALIVLFFLVDRKKFIRIVVPFAGAALCVVLLWSLRNMALSGNVPDHSLALDTFAHGIYPDLMYNGDPKTSPIPYKFDPQAAQMTSAGAVLRILKQRFVEQPFLYLRWFLVGKSVYLFQWNLQESIGDVYVYPVTQTPFTSNLLFVYLHKVMQFLHAPLTIAALLGIPLYWWQSIRSRMRAGRHLAEGLIICLLVYFILIHVIGCPMARYSIPLRPYVYGMGLYVIYRAILAGRQKWFADKRPDKEPL